MFDALGLSAHLREAMLYTLGATLLLIALVLLLGWVGVRVRWKIEAWRLQSRLSIRIQKAELLSSARGAALLVRAWVAFRLTLTVAALYFYASLVFSFFPATRAYAPTLLSYALAPLALVGRSLLDYLPNILVIITLILVMVLITRFVHFLFDALGKGTLHFKGFHPDWADTTYKIARFLIIAFTAVVIFPYLPGAGSAAFQGVSIFLGVLFSLGSGSAVSNIVAGIVLTYTRAFRLGDRIRVNDTEGDVIARTLIATHVRTIKNVDITIPNAVLLGNHMINFSTTAATLGLVLHTKVTIGYDVPWRTVHALLLDAAKKTDFILPDPAPFVLQTSLDDFYVSYQLNATIREPRSMAKIYSDLHQQIQDNFHNAGIEILSPHYTALRDGGAIAIPPENLPQDYLPAAIRVAVVN